GAPRRLLRLPADPARLARGLDRRLRADLAPRRMRARDHGGREELPRAGPAARPYRRRQLPPDAAGGSGKAGGDRGREEIQPAPRYKSARDGGYLHRRARRRPGQDGLAEDGARRRRHGRDARHQAHARSREPDEPRQSRSGGMIRLLLLLAVALPAWAQDAKTPPAEPRVEPSKEPERRPLNLRLDNPSSFATIAPAEKEQQKALPTLGG